MEFLQEKSFLIVQKYKKGGILEQTTPLHRKSGTFDANVNKGAKLTSDLHEQRQQAKKQVL